MFQWANFEAVAPTLAAQGLCWLLSISVPKKAIMLALPMLFLCMHASDE